MTKHLVILTAEDIYLPKASIAVNCLRENTSHNCQIPNKEH